MFIAALFIIINGKQPKCSSLELFYILTVVVFTGLSTYVKTCRMTNQVNKDAVN